MSEDALYSSIMNEHGIYLPATNDLCLLKLIIEVMIETSSDEVYLLVIKRCRPCVTRLAWCCHHVMVTGDIRC